MVIRLAFAWMLLGGVVAGAQTSRPTTRPAAQPKDPLKTMSAEQVLQQIFKPATNPTRMPPPQSENPVSDKTSGGGAVKPDAPTVQVKREGIYIVDRMVRLTHVGKDQAEITFDSDGKSLKDPPMIVLPNQKLMLMEDAVTSTSRDLRFRVTGLVTQYRGRNYILLEKVVVPLDVSLQF